MGGSSLITFIHLSFVQYWQSSLLCTHRYRITCYPQSFIHPSQNFVRDTIRSLNLASIFNSTKYGLHPQLRETHLSQSQHSFALCMAQPSNSDVQVNFVQNGRSALLHRTIASSTLPCGDFTSVRSRSQVATLSGKLLYRLKMTLVVMREKPYYSPKVAVQHLWSFSHLRTRL
jgi:hypothetical protein